ncbi:MAG: ABC transporter substrate-binding protein, partial [Acidimicrobiales bacterium]|nr:ABC transporter substrate-binding protein [Acidimicrobiales bacterium]
MDRSIPIGRAPLALLLAVGLVAAACSGESTTTETAVAGSVASTEALGTSEPGTTEPAPPSAPSEGGYVDPRGQLFTDFQATFDRSHPFGGLDSYCDSHAPDADPGPDPDPGITVDSIHIHHLDLDLDQVVEIGFAADVGDYRGMLEAFAEEINETCGGVRGRKLNIGISSFSPLSPDVLADANAACLEATEDNNAVFVVNFTSIQEPATLCVVEQHDTGMLTTTGFSEDAMRRGQNRLFTVTPTWERGLSVLARTAHEQGRLEGRTIGVVGSDLPGHTEVMQGTLIAELEALGYTVAVQEFLGCGGGTTCADGLQGVVSNLLDEDVDAVFPHLNLLSLPGLIQEMAVQGYGPGEVQFFNGGFNSQAG